MKKILLAAIALVAGLGTASAQYLYDKAEANTYAITKSYAEFE